MKALTVKHGMSNERTRVEVYRGQETDRRVYIPSDSSLARIDELIAGKEYKQICSSSHVLSITIFNEK